MPSYKVLTTSFINNSIHEAGTIIEYDGDPGPNLEPLKSSKRRAEPKPTQDEPQDEQQEEDTNG